MLSIEGFKVLEISPTALEVAEKIIAAGGVPRQYPEDALHVALAAAGGVDFLVTWNFSHINNPFTRAIIRQVIEGEGFRSPEFVSPDELLGGEE